MELQDNDAHWITEQPVIAVIWESAYRAFELYCITELFKG